jgi:hypothetical protein
MSPVDPKFYRRQKEVARQQKQKEKRLERASRRADREGAPADDGLAAIQAALDAGLTPGSPGWPGNEDETSPDDEGNG